ncbi:MAG: hypothetical protein F6K39_34735 [Okeania sp. SIO3B3]|nr:hypothetical protein [Okeania sp. SIO3B3]
MPNSYRTTDSTSKLLQVIVSAFFLSNLDFRFIYCPIVIALPPKRSLCLCRLMFYPLPNSYRTTDSTSKLLQVKVSAF